jgi:pimeloyl-ACP methyl ester carboxylesterase
MIRNSDDVLDVVLEFIDSQIQGKRFTLSGTSFGSILARGVMARRGDDVDGLLLVAPDIEHDPERAELPPRTLLVKDKAALAELQPHERGLFENDLVVQSHQALAILREVVFPAFGTGDREFLDRLSRHYVLSFDVDALSFDRPTLFLMGRQDHRTGYRDVWPLIENYPRATFAVLDRAGHTIGGVEQVELGIALIGDWLDRVEESIVDRR